MLTMTWKKSTSVAATQRLMEPAYFQAVNSQLTFSLPCFGRFFNANVHCNRLASAMFTKSSFCCWSSFTNLLCSCLSCLMPKRIKSALKLQSEKESRNIFTHLQCHDSGSDFQRCIMFRFLSQIDHIGLYKALVILGDFLPVRILWQPTFSYCDKSR